MCVPDVICRCLYIYFKMVDPFIDTGGIVDHHRLSKLSLHSVLLLEMPFVMDIVCSSFIPTQLIYQ